MIPPDFNLLHLVAIIILFASWFAYPLLLRMIGKTPLNSQLGVARHRWVSQIAKREANPFDAIMLGHVVHSVAFFGSATLIVLAGVVSMFVKLEAIHTALSGFHLIDLGSIELFVLMYSVLALVLMVCFFSFTYSLRKLLYSLALIGALPVNAVDSSQLASLVDNTTTIITESLKTFNFGIRGYYYAIACLGLFISPYFSILLTVLLTITLIYRQTKTPTSKAIANYISQI